MRIEQEDAYALKNLFGELFGGFAWTDIKESTDFSKWKKYCKRLLSSIDCSARQTIKISDDQWFRDLSREIESGKQSIDDCENFENLFAELSGCLGKVCFLQLGQVPNNYDRNRVSVGVNGNWDLNEHRSVQYVQNQEQARFLERSVMNRNKSGDTSDKEIDQEA